MRPEWRRGAAVAAAAPLHAGRIQCSDSPLFATVIRLAWVVEHRNLGDVPAVVGALDLELDHGDSVRRAAHNAESAADALLLVNDHIGAGLPGGARKLVQRVALYHAGQALHRDAVIGADIHAATAENADGGINHDVELALEAAPRL